MKKLNIAVLYDKNGCCFWRSYIPSKMMQKFGLANVNLIELKSATKQELAVAFRESDIIQMLGLMDTSGLAMLRQYQKLGCRVVVDFDDLHFNVDPFNPAYKNFGMEDVQVKDPKTGDVKFLWKDGTNGFNINANKIRFHSYVAVLKEANLVTCPTIYLKDAMLEMTEGQANVRVIPNAVDFTQWQPLDVRDKFSDGFRFGWAVSASHGADWLFIKAALKQFLEQHKDAKFVCIGDTHMDIRAGLPEGQVEWYPFSDLWEGHYQLRMPMLGLDAAICPLADLEFNRCKSPLKYIEYTAFGWPVVAQNMTPYKEHIIHGETGLLASTTEEWVNSLNALYNNKELRSKLRFSALQVCKELFDLEKVAREWAQIYTELVYGDSETCEQLTSYEKPLPLLVTPSTLLPAKTLPTKLEP